MTRLGTYTRRLARILGTDALPARAKAQLLHAVVLRR